MIAVGSLKEKYLRDAAAEYTKRLGAFCKLRVEEVAEHRLPQSPSPAQVENGLAMEGRGVQAKVPKGARVYALCIEGRQRPSARFAEEMQAVSAQTSQVVFVIGGSHGLCDSVKAAAHQCFSMSEMTFPHQLARIMLLEQLYRAFSIGSGGKYHK